MSYFNIFSQYDDATGERIYEMFEPRQTVINKLQSAHKDIVVVGGNLIAAQIAWLGALQGFSVLLLDEHSFGTQGVSSYDTSLYSVFEDGGIGARGALWIEQEARRSLEKSAPHLGEIQETIVVPISKSSLMSTIKEHVKRALFSLSSQLSTKLVQDFGGFAYAEQIYNFQRITLETLFAARQEGAHIMNHARVILCNHRKDNRVAISWHDLLNDVRHECTAGIVVNCTEGAVATMGRVASADFAHRIGFAESLEVHVLTQPFSQRLMYPVAGVCITPILGGSVIGTKPKASQGIPQKTPQSDTVMYDLIEKISSLGLKTFFPREAMTSWKKVVHPYLLETGLRGRSHHYEWIYAHGSLNLVGGSPTRAWEIARTCIAKIIEVSKASMNLMIEEGRPLPGATQFRSQYIEHFQKICLERGLSGALSDRTVRRMGAFVRYLLEEEASLLPIGEVLLQGERTFAEKVYMAVTEDDFLAVLGDVHTAEERSLIKSWEESAASPITV